MDSETPTFTSPTISINLDTINVDDDCCSTNTITWIIPPPESNGTIISGIGQPSQTLGGKKL